MITPPFPPVTGHVVPHAQTHWHAFNFHFCALDHKVGAARLLLSALRDAIAMHPHVEQRVLAETVRVKLIQVTLNRSPATVIADDFSRLDDPMQNLWSIVAQRVPALNDIAAGGRFEWL